MFNHRSRATLFLMEQLIVLAVFAICAVVCVKLFVVSYTMVIDSKNLNNALLIAESSAECYKATSGNAEKTALTLGGIASNNPKLVEVYYNDKWNVCKENEAAFVMRLAIDDAEESLVSASPVLGDLSIEKITGEEIFSLTIAARRDLYE